jgi:hypothetical protein
VATEKQETMLRPTATLVVSVLAEGEPSAGRIVSVQEAVPGSAETGLTTGEDGKATFALAPDKQYRLSTAIEAGSATEHASVIVPGGQITEYTFAFHRIFGHIVDAVGNPVRQRPLSMRMSTAIQSDDVYHGPQMDDVQTKPLPERRSCPRRSAPKPDIRLSPYPAPRKRGSCHEYLRLWRACQTHAVPASGHGNADGAPAG